MNLTAVIFWDTDYSKIDWEEKAQFIITRVIEYGTANDWKEVKQFYGYEKIKQAMLRERDLSDRSLSFLSCVLSVPKEDFRCYKNKQSRQLHWSY